MDLIRKTFAFFSGRERTDSGKVLDAFLRKYPEYSRSVPAAVFRSMFLADGKMPPPDKAFLLFPDLPVRELADQLTDASSSGRMQEALAAMKETPVLLKQELLSLLLSFFPACSPLTEEQKSELKEAAHILGFSSAEVEELFRKDAEERKNKQNLMHSGTGLVAAVVIIILFFLSALYLRTVFFGFILSVLFLPLERFLEKRIFKSKVYRTLEKILALPFLPLVKLKQLLLSGGKQIPVPQEEQLRRDRRLLSMKGAGATIILLIILAGTILTAAAFYLTPFAMNTGKQISEWASRNQIFHKAENTVNYILEKKTKVQSAVSGTEVQTAEVQPQENAPGIQDQLRHHIKKLVQENAGSLTGFVFGSGSDLVGFLLSLIQKLGKFTFDFLLTLFFFFAFLQQIAFYTNDAKGTIGEWTVGTIFGSAWLPLTDDETRQSAAGIFDHVCGMFNSWLRGYACIIGLEWILYPIAFTIIGVPYAIPLALLSGCAVLIPVIGPIVCIGTTYAVTLAFADTNIAFTLIGLTITYLTVNTFLEQLILYPTLVGRSVGLTFMETIVVILLSSLLGSLIGMIIAIPAAALLKYLIPQVYQTLRTAFHSSVPDVSKEERRDLPQG